MSEGASNNQREGAAEVSLRPKRLAEFVGQKQECANLKVFIKAARSRKQAMDHALLAGPPGLGKTSLARIIAHELSANLRTTSGPIITKAGDLAALLTNLEEGDVLFIDEIHRLSPAIEEVLYSAMEDFELDLLVGEGPAARSIRIALPPFTLIGATTRSGLLTTPLRERFGIHVYLRFYEPRELEEITTRNASLLNMKLTPEGAQIIAQRARGTPRIAGRLLRRVRDFAELSDSKEISAELAEGALQKLDIDGQGLDGLDHLYLKTIAEKFHGGPVGVETIAAALSEPRDAIEDIVEPYLMQIGFIQRTPKGRKLMAEAFHHLGLPVPEQAEAGLFEEGEK